METTKTYTTFKTILFATDLSPAANKALPYAVEIARRFGSTVYAVHASQPGIYPVATPSGWMEAAQVEEELREEGKRHLEEELQGLPHELIFLFGDVWQNLSNMITEKQIDLVVLGTHGRTGIAKAAMGSVAESIFRQATCPVLTVGPLVPSEARHSAAAELNHVLYATDFSPESMAAAPYAISLAREHKAQLILLHAIENAKPGEINSALQALRDVFPLGTQLTTEPQCLVERGAPAVAILKTAADHSADLIVLGVRNVRGHITTTTHFAQSTAYKVVTQATCPILTVRG